MRQRSQIRYIVAFLLMGVAGVAAAGYVLVHERLSPPFQALYNVRIELTAANGVAPGLGQPVNVAGVQIGSVTGVQLSSGVAAITLQLNRHQVPHVYANAVATLDPVTPLGDVEIDLDPGRPPAPPLGADATLPVGQTTAPVPLADLLDSLDGDTRDFLTSLIASFSQGTARQGANIRNVLLALGPTTTQVHELAGALATRRTELAQLVHNLAIVTRSASDDRQLASVVTGGADTLEALDQQDTSLRAAIAKLPGTLNATNATLSEAALFAGKLQPTLSALLPAVKRLPNTLLTLRPLADATTSTLATSVRPLVTQLQPLAGNLGSATPQLTALTPSLESSFQALRYAFNELAYNGGSSNPGFLYWLAWFAHDWNSAFSFGDAHGAIGRASVLLSCQQFANAVGDLGPVFGALLGTANLCPAS